MDCGAVRDALLTREDEAPPAVAKHVAGCEPCRAYAEASSRLDHALRVVLVVPPPPPLRRQLELLARSAAPELRRLQAASDPLGERDPGLRGHQRARLDLPGEQPASGESRGQRSTRIAWFRRLPRLGGRTWSLPLREAAAQLAAVALVSLAGWRLVGWIDAARALAGDVPFALQVASQSTGSALRYLETLRLDSSGLLFWSAIGLLSWLVSESSPLHRFVAPAREAP